MSALDVTPRGRRLNAGAHLAVVVGALTLVAFALRLAAARGDLWLDEIWTFRLLDGVRSFGAIFVDLPYDNNHPLNTAWLALVGPNASPTVVRLASVVFGALCAPVAACIGHRRNEQTAIFAAALVACDGILVHYGSEARGYSGMILASLVALDALERWLTDPSRRTPLWVLAAATALGTLSQLSMVMTSGVLAGTAAVRLVMDRGWSRTAVRRLLPVGLALAMGTLPAAWCFLLSVSHGILHTGLSTPFSWPSFAIGLARLAEATLGLPDGQSVPWSVAILGITVAATPVALAQVPRESRVFPVLAIFGLPLIHAVLRLPNEQFARFHLVTGLGLLMLAIELFARASRHRMRPAVLALAIAGQAYNVGRLVNEGRGSFREPVALMGANGPATVIVRPKILTNETGAVIRWYAAKSGAALVAAEPACPATAQWLLLAREPGDPLDAPPQDIAGGPGCAARFELQSAYPAYGLSGFPWLLFRRTPTK